MVRPRHNNVVPGQHIYAYCNVKTKQVLYSLTRTLQHKQLQQLPDTGANNNPPKLRKDLWRPLWSVQLPDGEDGVAQGLEAYKMLRDFRILHETTWEPPKSMSVPYTAAQIEKLETRLDRRGGSKKESPYDLIARRKWKMRVQMVMDQKTNSIADLAAVLLRQDKFIGKQLAARNAARRAEIKEMVKLADLWEANDGAARRELEAQIEEWIKMRDARQEDRRWRKLNSKIDAARLTLAKMDFAAEWVPYARQQASIAGDVEEPFDEPTEGNKEVAASEQEPVEKEQASVETESANAEASQNPQTKDGNAEEAAVRRKRQPQTSDANPPPSAEEMLEQSPSKKNPWTRFLPSYPPELARQPLTASKTTRKTGSTPKRAFPPVFSLQGEGVTVRWANTMDAEYAAEWPALVRHEPMGIVRNTAPRADDETPFLEVSDFKAVGWKSRNQGFMLEPTLAEKVAERRAKMGLVEHPTLKNKFTKGVASAVVAAAPVVEGEEVEHTTTEDGVQFDEHGVEVEKEPVYDPVAEAAAAEQYRKETLEKLPSFAISAVNQKFRKRGSRDANAATATATIMDDGAGAASSEARI